MERRNEARVGGTREGSKQKYEKSERKLSDEKTQSYTGRYIRKGNGKRSARGCGVEVNLGRNK